MAHQARAYPEFVSLKQLVRCIATPPSQVYPSALSVGSTWVEKGSVVFLEATKVNNSSNTKSHFELALVHTCTHTHSVMWPLFIVPDVHRTPQVVPCPRTQHSVPGQGSNPDHSIQTLINHEATVSPTYEWRGVELIIIVKHAKGSL